MGASPLKFGGSIEEADFSRVQQSLLPRWLRWYVTVPAALAFFIGTGSGWLEAFQSPASTVPDLLFALVVLAACWAIIRFGRRRAWKNYVRLHGTVSGQLTSDGLEWKTETTTTSMPWAKITGHSLSSELALLYYAPRCAFFLPRKFLSSEKDWEELEHLVRTHSQRI